VVAVALIIRAPRAKRVAARRDFRLPLTLSESAITTAAPDATGKRGSDLRNDQQTADQHQHTLMSASRHICVLPLVDDQELDEYGR
jgi:hypothetical protein